MNPLLFLVLVLLAWAAITGPIAVVAGPGVRLADERAAADPERVL